MKGRNWRDFEPPEKRRRKPRRYEEPPRGYVDVYQPPKRKKRRRKGGIFRRLLVLLILFVLGYGGFFLYYRYGKPYTVALDAGHGGEDVGSVGVIQEVQLTEQTVTALEKLLKEDGRFRVVLTRKMGEGMSITDRNRKLAFLPESGRSLLSGNPAVSGGRRNHRKSNRTIKTKSFLGLLHQKTKKAEIFSIVRISAFLFFMAGIGANPAGGIPQNGSHGTHRRHHDVPVWQGAFSSAHGVPMPCPV